MPPKPAPAAPARAPRRARRKVRLSPGEVARLARQIAGRYGERL